VLDRERWVPLAEIARPHGVKGEVRLKLFNTASDVLLTQDEVLVRTPEGEEHEVSVDRARRADDAILMKLYSVDDRDRAEELRGSHICVRRKDFPPLEEGEHYTIDLVGAEARMNGEKLGTVMDVTAYPTVDVLVVNDGKQVWEIPMSEEYVGNVDAENALIEVLSLDELEPIPTRKPKPKPQPQPQPAEADEKKKDA
jgi:16S rRNA processing protein RimM